MGLHSSLVLRATIVQRGFEFEDKTQGEGTHSDSVTHSVSDDRSGVVFFFL